MTIASVTNLRHSYGGPQVLDGTTLSIAENERIGLVGRNGCGKSTLLKVLAGELNPDFGTVSLARGSRIGYLSQHPRLDPSRTLREEAASAFEGLAAIQAELEKVYDEMATAEGERLEQLLKRQEHLDAKLEHAGGYAVDHRIDAVLHGLGFDDAAFATPVTSLSGGQKARLGLAKLLLDEPDLLLLDEPTNHLDLEASLWLEAFLRRWPRGLLLVSHDRNVLNAVSTHILHLHDGALALYPGDYDRFERVRAERMEHAAAQASRQAARARHLQSFVDRFRAKASKARQAQSRIKMLEKLESQRIDLERDDPAIRLRFPTPTELRPPLISMEGASVGYAPGAPILRRLDLRLDPDDRIALVGANGNGKSTLAKLLSGRLAPLSGMVNRAPKLEVGFFAQHQIEEMRPGRTAFHHLSDALPREAPEQIRARLGAFGFSGDKADLPVGELSGGERARLNFALVTCNRPSLLILDEPTNHLDIPSREALVDAINDFEGAVVLVTHDLHLIELSMDRLWLVADGGVKSFDGDVEEYRALVLGDRAARGDQASRAAREEGQPASARERRAAAAGRRQALAPLRNGARAAEKEVATLDAERARLEAQLADPALYADAARATALARRRGEVASALAAAEERWLALAEELEKAERDEG